MDLQMVKYLAELGKLDFSDAELEKIAQEMTGIMELMDTIKEIDISYDAFADNKNVFLPSLREDKQEPSFDTAKILANAKNSNNCFVVPKVVE